jgi:hypothetical protein
VAKAQVPVLAVTCCGLMGLVEDGRNWVHVSVVDDATGRPVPCRVHFRSAEGIPYQPHGHHNHVAQNLNSWHYDVGGDIRLGQRSYAYIDGTCQGWLPRGDVVVDVARGFEYEPLRQTVQIEPGQRDLTLRIGRVADMASEGWWSGDSHVHFLSTPGHFPNPNGEPAVLVATGRADAVEMLAHSDDAMLEYYRYLNSGYRLPLVGGTDKMSSDVPVGLYRTYARLDEEFSYEAWCRAVRSGRTFFSGGPLVTLSVDGCEPGGTVELSGPGTVSIHAAVRSIFPLRSVEVVRNGEVVARAEANGGRQAGISEELRIDGTSWIACRSAGQDMIICVRGGLEPLACILGTGADACSACRPRVRHTLRWQAAAVVMGVVPCCRAANPLQADVSKRGMNLVTASASHQDG